MYADSRAPAASTSSTCARRRAQTGRDEHDRADVRARRISPTPARATSAEPQRAAATGPYQRSHAARRSRDQTLADAGDAHFFARRRGCREVNR